MTQNPLKRSNASSGPTSVKKGRSGPLVNLVSLTTTWEVFENEVDKIGFHVTTKVTVDQPDSQVDIIQYHMDGLSIKSGANGVEAVPFRMTNFAKDKTGGTARVTKDGRTIATLEDYPGYEKGTKFQAQTDLKYIFGAKWEIMVGNVLLVEASELFAVISGTFGHHGRTIVPAQPVTAIWDQARNRWDNSGALLTTFPGWHPYPQPPVDNDPADSGSDTDSSDSDYSG